MNFRLFEKCKTSEKWQAFEKQLDTETIKACNTKIWYDPSQYQPTEREKPYVVGEIKGEVNRKEG